MYDYRTRLEELLKSDQGTREAVKIGLAEIFEHAGGGTAAYGYAEALFTKLLAKMDEAKVLRAKLGSL